MEEIKQRVAKFITRFCRKDDLTGDDDIFALGLVNSLFAMQLLMFIEKEFGIVVENENLDMNNFRTINSISELISKLQ